VYYIVALVSILIVLPIKISKVLNSIASFSFGNRSGLKLTRGPDLDVVPPVHLQPAAPIFSLLVGRKETPAAEPDGSVAFALRWEYRAAAEATAPGLGDPQVAAPRRKNVSFLFAGQSPTAVARAILWMDLVSELVGTDPHRVDGKKVGIWYRVAVAVLLVIGSFLHAPDRGACPLGHPRK
jgi:hypothetical protein